MVDPAHAANAADEEAKGGAEQKRQKTSVNKNVVVKERDFKSASTHSDIVTGVTTISDDEFLTSSQDMSLKIWDKFT